MSLTLEGMKYLETIRQHPGTSIYQYHIHVKGYFDKQSYDDYIKKGDLLGENIINDHTIFFRACPFVKSGKGCTLPPRYRTVVCNFFICSEIFDRPDLKEVFEPYLNERTRYARWEHRENLELQHVLFENGLDLKNNFEDSIEVLRNTPVYNYDFPHLEPVEFDSGHSQSA